MYLKQTIKPLEGKVYKAMEIVQANKNIQFLFHKNLKKNQKIRNTKNTNERTTTSFYFNFKTMN